MNVVRSFKAVAWSLLGIRKSSEFQEDFGRLNPFHVIVAAVLAVAFFVAALMALVNWVAG